MPRRREVPQRPAMPDPIYNSELVSRFVTSIMTHGKRSTAEKIFYGAFNIIEEKTGSNPLEVFEQALDKAKPTVEVKSRRVGGSTYQVPTEIRFARQRALAIRWIIDFARKRSEKDMASKLAGEMMDAANNRGGTIKKKEDTHKMAEANKAFAHYRW